MPWTSLMAKTHTHLADTVERQELWAKIANEQLRKHGDEGRAIREANAAIHRTHKSKA